MAGIADFSILAPVPLEHLQSGRAIADATGFVAIGSRKWELFRKVDDLRGGARVPVLIYPSHEDVPAGQRLPISAVQTIKGGWRKTAPPRGPELVATPSTLELSP